MQNLAMAYHHGNLHDALIHHAQSLLELQGPDGLSLRDVAKNAGVSHNAPYRHFKDKKALLDELIAVALKSLAEQIQSASLIYPFHLLMQVQFVGRLFMQLAYRSPRKAHLLFTGLCPRHDHNPSAIQATHHLIILNIKSLLGEALGRDLHSETDIDTLAVHLLAYIRGLALLKTSQIGFTGDDEEDLFNLCDSGIENLLKAHSF